VVGAGELLFPQGPESMPEREGLALHGLEELTADVVLVESCDCCGLILLEFVMVEPDLTDDASSPASDALSDLLMVCQFEDELSWSVEELI